MQIIHAHEHQYLIRCDNGYGLSVINDGYGRKEGLVEAAVIRWEGDNYYLDMTTPAASDVIGWLDASGLAALVKRVEKLPKHNGLLGTLRKALGR